MDDFTSCGAGHIGIRIRVLPVVTSTNDLLRIEAEDCLATEGDILVAEHQTTGRARLDRSWESPPGKSLLFSMLLYPKIPSGYLQLIGLMASLGVLDGLSDYLQRDIQHPERYIRSIRLKWPNDIMAGKRKLCGILSDGGIDKTGRSFTVVGIGINVNQSLVDFPVQLRSIATSLYIMTGIEHSRTRLLKAVVASFEGYYNRLTGEGSNWIAPDWLERAGIKGRRIEIKQNGESITGICVGLNEDGAMQLQIQDGQVRVIYCGDVR